MSTNDTSPLHSLSSSVLERIEEEQITPRARGVFLSRDFAIWTLWLLSVLLGAVSIAVTLSVLAHGWFTLYEITHDTASRFWLEALPYAWLLVFLAMTIAGIYNLRHTKRGYRYPLTVVLLSSLGGSVGLGLLLQTIGFGFVADKQLGQYSVLYESQAEREERYWQRPEAGRLVGIFLPPPSLVDPALSSPLFRDIKGVEWEINLSELTDSERRHIVPGQIVRVAGLVESQELPKFYACQVLPWIYEYEHTLSELSEIRKGAREIRGEMYTRGMRGESFHCMKMESLGRHKVQNR
jgi:hypothetical protein